MPLDSENTDVEHCGRHENGLSQVNVYLRKLTREEKMSTLWTNLEKKKKVHSHNKV